MNLDDAITKHSEWKIKFRSAISKNEVMDVATISKDNCCDLGKWLHGEAVSKFGKLDSYKNCVAKHAAFHTEASKVASAINVRKYAEAEAMLKPGTAFANASSAVGVSVLLLKKEAASHG